MALILRPIEMLGLNLGVVFTLENVGDEFALHSHPNESDNHITVAIYGKIELLGKHAGVIIEPKPGGTIIDWPIIEEHGFRALTAGATGFNIRKAIYVEFLKGQSG
jgi:hypothetical protein